MTGQGRMNLEFKLDIDVELCFVAKVASPEALSSAGSLNMPKVVAEDTDHHGHKPLVIRDSVWKLLQIIGR